MIRYHVKKQNGQIQHFEHIASAFSDWQEKERWLFLAPHDDDIVIGAGNTLLAAVNNNVEVHCAITTNGYMGYCTPEHKNTIEKIREEECFNSFKTLGVEHVHFLHFPDCALTTYSGRTFNTTGDASEIAGATGLQNSYVHLLREVRPTRLFLPTVTDLHPDHQATHKEMLISVFHAEGGIWPELGERIEAIPTIYEYAVYTDFSKSPQICIELPQDILDKKLQAIYCYKSQTQIENIIKKLNYRFEFIHEMEFDFYDAKKYQAEFKL